MLTHWAKSYVMVLPTKSSSTKARVVSWGNVSKLRRSEFVEIVWQRIFSHILCCVFWFSFSYWIHFSPYVVLFGFGFPSSDESTFHLLLSVLPFYPIWWPLRVPLFGDAGPNPTFQGLKWRPFGKRMEPQLCFYSVSFDSLTGKFKSMGHN